VPKGLSAVQVTAIWQQYLTAYGPLVEYSDLGPGKTVLVTAATASVGHACIQLAKVQGAKVIATTRQPGKAARLLQTGADHVIVTSQQPLARIVLELTEGRGADVIVELSA
jgi:NADPH:quinone reductase-like Zn-dependent oxidoreductase